MNFERKTSYLVRLKLKREIHRFSSFVLMDKCSLSILHWLGLYRVSLNTSFLSEGVFFFLTLIVFFF